VDLCESPTIWTRAYMIDSQCITAGEADLGLWLEIGRRSIANRNDFNDSLLDAAALPANAANAMWIGRDRTAAPTTLIRFGDALHVSPNVSR